MKKASFIADIVSLNFAGTAARNCEDAASRIPSATILILIFLGLQIHSSNRMVNFNDYKSRDSNKENKFAGGQMTYMA